MSDLSGFVNVAKLEGVIQTLLTRMDAQQSRIEQLERSAAQSVSIASFNALSQRVEATIEHVNAQFGLIDRRLAEIGEEMAAAQEVLATLPALRATLDAKLDTETYNRRTEEIRNQNLEALSAVKGDKASKSVVSSLETSQHRLVEEVLALQKLLACKIDRVEVPLLDVASEKLQFLLDFQASADARLDRSESDIVSLQRGLATKESRETAAKTVASLREEIARKVEGAFVREQVLAPLNEAQDEIVRLKAGEEALERLMTDYHQHIEKFTRVEKQLHEVRTDSTRLATELRSLSANVVSKVDQSSLDALVFSNSDEVEQLVRSYEAKAAHESKVQQAYLSDVRLQLEDMQRYQNSVDAKLQMALKFIDWFTDVKMKHV